jgi:DHA1 family tetracycline resistance protein-like MFS transporter
MTQQKTNKSALAFIFVTILVDVIGIGIIIPVIPKLIKSLTGEELDVAAGYGGLLMVSFALMQFIFSPIMGELSDRFGRRPILLISLFGLGIDYIFHALAPTIGWLFIGRFLAGITGASFTVATAYIADVSTKENKAKNFGLIGAAFGLGFIIGPVIGGVFARYGVQAPFYVAAGLTLLNFLFGLFFVPESLPPEKRRKINYKKMIPFVSLVDMKKYKIIIGLIVAFTLTNLGGQALPSTWSFYTMKVFSWEEAEVGYSLGVIGILVAIVQAGLIGWVVKKFGTKKTILGGYILLCIGMTLLSFSYNVWLLFAFITPYIMGGVAGPTLQGLMSNEVLENEQGNLQGVLTSMTSLTSILGPLICTGLFYYFSGTKAPIYFPGAPYLFSGLIFMIATLIVFNSLKNKSL